MRILPFLKAVRLTLALRRARAKWNPHDNYGLSTSPVFWRNAFLYYYRHAPSGDTDPRWDELFELGFPLVRKLRKDKAR